VRRTRRRYREGTLILETEFDTGEGAVEVIDCMSLGGGETDLIRIVAGKRGRVEMQTELVIRFDYGSIIPWVRRTQTGIRATAGPDTLLLHTPVPVRGEDFRTVAEFSVSEGERIPFTLVWHRSHEAAPEPIDPERSVSEAERWWGAWSARCAYDGPWR